MREYYINLSEHEKIKKGNYAKNRNIKMVNEDGEIKKEYRKNYYNKRKNLLIHLINHIE